jgi:magnesium transporter
MLTATLTGSIISHYEVAIGTYAILTAFFPMLMGTGGNAGSQSSVAVIRSLSLGEIEARDVLSVLWKEFRVSLLCGVTLAIATFIKLMLIDFRLQFTTVTDAGIVQNNLVLSLIISLTLLCAIVVAKLVGTVLPIGAKRIGLDPAVMASPFITTIVDTVTLVIYFDIASRILGF